MPPKIHRAQLDSEGATTPTASAKKLLVQLADPPKIRATDATRVSPSARVRLRAGPTRSYRRVIHRRPQPPIGEAIKPHEARYGPGTK